MSVIKKICISIIFCIILILINNKVNATTITISPSEPKVGDEVKVTVTVPNVHTSSVTANVSGVVSGKIKVVGGDLAGEAKNYSNSATFKCEKEGKINVEIGSDSSAVLNGQYVDVSAQKSVAVKAKEVSNTTDNQNSTNTGNNTTTSKSKEARLKTFGIKPNDFTGFKKDKTEYSTEVPNNISEVTVYATAVDSKAKITGTGKISLKEGNNTVKVTVTAEAGNTKTYNLTIKRKTATEEASSTTTTTTTTTEPETSNTTNTSNAFGLDSLDIDDITLSPKFDTEVYEYTAELNKDLSSLEISTIPTDDDTTVEIAGNKDLKDGENIITIIVQSKKTKKTVTYQITVNKNVLATENNNEEVKEANWMNPSTWGKEEIIKMIIIAVLLILIIVAIILKVKISKEKKEDEIDLPGADELDRAIAEHQELSELEENENNTWNWDDDFQEDFNEAPKKKGKGKHF